MNSPKHEVFLLYSKLQSASVAIHKVHESFLYSRAADFFSGSQV